MTKAKDISREEADKWQRIAAKFRTASELLSEIRVDLVCNMGLTADEMKIPLKFVDEGIDSISGNSYMFTPQSEWTGSDSHNEINFKMKAPHITTVE